MCERPLTFNGYEVQCRECGQCLATYKNTWVARCVAQKVTSQHAYAVTLTYADVNGEPPLGAKVMRYKDVSDLWKRIRSAISEKWPDEETDFRYVVVGEKGTRFGRCHYHGVLFCSHDLSQIGEFSQPSGDGFEFKRRLNWTTWGHGFVEFQPADRAGMAYVLKYILKGKMNAKASQGQNREGKTEWLAASYLWCSKVPSIGSVWLWHKLRSLVKTGMCPASLMVRVPGGGDWYVSGRLQQEMCLFLREQNARYNEERGRDLSGWKSLVASVSNEIELADTGEIVPRKPWEWLINGIEEQQEEPGREQQARSQFQQFSEDYARKRRTGAAVRNARAIVGRCGAISPCEACEGNIGKHARANLETEYAFRFEAWRVRFPSGTGESASEYEARFQRWWLTRLKVNRYCGLRDLPEIADSFKYLVPLEKARPGARYKRAIGKTL